MVDDGALARGLRALDAWSLEEARASFEEALAGEETVEALEGLAAAAGWLDDAETSIDARERAYRLYRGRGDDESAARVACTIALDVLSLRGDSAVASGWVRRARTLMTEPGSPSMVTVLALESMMARGYDKDMPRARALSEEAVDLAHRLGYLGIEMIARAHLGLVLVSSGEVAEGMHLLDEATAAAVGGELEDLETAVNVCCFMVTACLRSRDLSRAAQWSRYVLGRADQHRSAALFDYPRSEHAAVLTWWGRWDEAEKHLLAAIDEAANRPVAAALGKLYLADLRRRQGRFDQAEALLNELDAPPHRFGLGPLTTSARAMLAFARGLHPEAAGHAEAFLRVLPEGDPIERVDALEVLARSRAALGDADRAEGPAEELRGIAAKVGTAPLRAVAELATGLVSAARGDLERGRASLERARDLFAQAEAPLEAAQARLELAELLIVRGDRVAAAGEARAARAAFASLGAAHESARAGRLEAEIQGGRDPSGVPLSDREVDVLRLVAAGRSNEEIAGDLVLSIRTVERHISNIYSKIGVSGRTARVAASGYAHRHGLT